MKCLMVAALALVAAVAPAVSTAADSVSAGSASRNLISLADARRQIAEVVANPQLATTVMKQLSVADQLAFIGEVNAAIGNMPGSASERALRFVDVNRAMMKGADRANVTSALAEVFATVPVYALPAVSEDFAETLFNRTGEYSEERFVRIAQKAMSAINARLESVDDAEVRSSIAALMFVRASNMKEEDIVATMIGMLPEKARETAKNDWFPSALAKNGEKSYEVMTGENIKTGAELRKEVTGTERWQTVDSNGTRMDSVVSRNIEELKLLVPAPVFAEGILADIDGASTDPLLYPAANNPVVDALQTAFEEGAPNLAVDGGAPSGNGDSPNGKDKPGDEKTTPTPTPAPTPRPPEPGPYYWQHI